MATATTRSRSRRRAARRRRSRRPSISPPTSRRQSASDSRPAKRSFVPQPASRNSSALSSRATCSTMPNARLATASAPRARLVPRCQVHVEPPDSDGGGAASVTAGVDGSAPAAGAGAEGSAAGDDATGAAAAAAPNPDVQRLAAGDHDCLLAVHQRTARDHELVRPDADDDGRSLGVHRRSCRRDAVDQHVRVARRGARRHHRHQRDLRPELLPLASRRGAQLGARVLGLVDELRQLDVGLGFMPGIAACACPRL